MIYRKQNDEINNGNRHSRIYLLTCVAKVFFCNGTDLQYQIFLINMITHVATAVDHEVSQGNYVAWSSKLAKRQQVHAVIEIIIDMRLTEGYICQNFTHQNH